MVKKSQRLVNVYFEQTLNQVVKYNMISIYHTSYIPVVDLKVWEYKTTVFPRIVSAETVLFYVEYLVKFCYSLGGYDGKNWLNTTEIIYPNGSKTEGPIELPELRDSHCMVEYAGMIILMGGGYANYLCN